MLPWNRLDSRGAAAVLLASLCLPIASAEDTPSRRIKLRPRPRIQQVAAEEETSASRKATERWNDLKSKYAEDVESASARPQAREVSRPQSLGSIRPFPDDEPEEEESSNTADWGAEEIDEQSLSVACPLTARPSEPSDEPLPITGFEQPPDWVLGGSTEAEDESEDDEAGEWLPSRLARRTFGPAAEDAGDEESSRPGTESEALKEEEPKAPSGVDSGYTPMPAGSRRPRQIKDISPRYDLEIDRDIREFAKEQAQQYGLEFGKGAYEPRAFYGMAYQWEPSNFYHYPLYFEDPQLERYGHTYGHLVQPIVSIARFSGQLIMLPYQMTLDPPCCPQYTLGWYRPGDCAPYLHYQLPLNAQAAAVEAGVITGLFFLIP